jgi:membrane protease YdiL (CAAX protease family)
MTAEPFTLARYARETREIANSAILTAPLFVLYQVGILFTDGWKNGADFVTSFMWGLAGGGVFIYTAINLIVLAAFAILYQRRRASRTLHRRTPPMVIVESTLYAAILGPIVAGSLLRLGLEPAASVSAYVAAGQGEPGGIVNAVVLSIGAGTYEELFFRLMLLGGLLAILPRTRLPSWSVVPTAIVVSSLIFSAFHYFPFGMDRWQLWSFTFRFGLGVVLAWIYRTRGFAVAVYTHAIYDLMILVPRSIGL